MYEVKIKKFRWSWEVSLNICEIGIYLSMPLFLDFINDSVCEKTAWEYL
jgi:hypothetical protein